MKKEKTISILRIFLMFYSFVAILNIGLYIYLESYSPIKIGLSCGIIISFILFLLNRKIGTIIFLIIQIFNIALDIMFLSGFQSIFTDLFIIIITLFLSKYEEKVTL